MAVTSVANSSLDERKASGREAQKRTPASSHQGWSPAVDRPDPVALLEQQNRTRELDLVPVRHGRMMVSPFTFYRGAAKIISERYADQNERDFEDFVKSIRSGRLEALADI
jgi:hypothetical protein